MKGLLIYFEQGLAVCYRGPSSLNKVLGQKAACLYKGHKGAFYFLSHLYVTWPISSRTKDLVP